MKPRLHLDFLPGHTKFYIHKALFYLTPPVLSVLLYFYGGTPEDFDKIYIAALALSCIFCWKDKDTLGALLILLGYWLLSKPLYMAPNAWPVLLVAYSVCLGVSVYYFHHITAKILLVLTLYSIGAELYWSHIEYQSRPKLFYWVGLLAINLWARQLLFNRVFIAHTYFNYTSGKMSLDGHAILILNAYFYLVLCVTIEYFIRHITGLGHVAYIYALFTPVSTLLTAVTLAVVYMHYFYYQSQKHLPA